jgi:antitoxin component of MazEF toxin-antitoxin module
MVRIQRKSNGQTVVTIPEGLASALKLEGGEQAEWTVQSGSALRLDIDG